MLKDFFTKPSETYPSETLDILRLIRSENIGIKTFYNLIQFYGTAKTAIEHLPDFMTKIGKNKFTLFSEKDLESELNKMAKIGAKYITYKDEKYPLLLKQIEDAPPILTFKGNIDLASNKCAAIVGSRNCSLAGKQMTSKISKELSYCGIKIVSGLARGIDTEAHLAAEPNTIAVIAGGIGNIYPPENHKLYSRIEEEGLIIAELPVGTAPIAKHFPQRNRIISGLSNAVLIIEASLNSGSLITAKFALEQNREIFACPGFPLDLRHYGTNKLIKDGANLLENSQDVIEFFDKTNWNNFNEERNLSIKSEGIFRQTDEKLINKENKELILNCISSVPCSVMDIINQTQLPIAIIATILLELELTGKIVYQPCNRIVLNFANI